MRKRYFHPFTSKVIRATMSATASYRRLSVLSSRVWNHWQSTIVVFSAATALVGLYVTDWRVTNTKIPFYGKKFDDDSNL